MKLLPRQWVSQHWNQNLLCNPLAEILHYKRQVGTPRPYLTPRVGTSVFLKTTVNIQVVSEVVGYKFKLHRERKVFSSPGFYSHSTLFFYLSKILSKIAVTWQKLEILTLPETPTKILHFFFFLFGKYWHGSSYYFAHSLSLMPLIVKTAYKSKVLILFLPAKEKLSTLENIVKPGKTVFHSLGYVWPWVSKLSKLFEFQLPQW